MPIPPLFDERPPFDRERLERRLRALAAERVFVGTSSWKYEGWLGQVYSRERYLFRGGFSQKRFEAECLAEYARTFPVVCGDFTFYQFPSPAHWRKLFDRVPETLGFAFKAPEEITARVFPETPRYAARGGTLNHSFLDVELLRESFLKPLEPYRERVRVLIFEFGAFSQKAYAHAREFAADLDRFLGALPPGFRYSVEIRNPEFLQPEYFECLARHGVAHVFNAWSRMPELGAQIANPDAFTAEFTVCRALLRAGRSYADAVKLFSPYEEIQDPNPEGRQAIRDLVEWAKANRRSAFIYVNNRFEGNAPRTIEGIVS
ncbi:MAG TPA: DUF72 domain-containing protein [Bryobacteraceae bacterium]